VRAVARMALQALDLAPAHAERARRAAPRQRAGRRVAAQPLRAWRDLLAVAVRAEEADAAARTRSAGYLRAERLAMFVSSISKLTKTRKVESQKLGLPGVFQET
jgi:hypothetical protein